MSNEIPTVPHLLDVIGATMAATSRNVFNVQADILSGNRKRAELIAEARGILENLCVVDSYTSGTLTAKQYNRLREILDGLERLP